MKASYGGRIERIKNLDGVRLFKHDNYVRLFKHE